MTFVDGVGWLTWRESKWWEADEGILSDFNVRQHESWSPPKYHRRIATVAIRELGPFWFAKKLRDGEIVGDAASDAVDKRWEPGAPFTAPSLGGAARIGWFLEGREIRPRAVPWVHEF